MEDKCYWCLTRISRTHSNMSWICDYESSNCDNHPVKYNVNPVLSEDWAPHQTESEVHEIIKRYYYVIKSQKSGKYLREVGDNVVMISKKARLTSRKSAEKVLPHTGSIRRRVYDMIKSNNDYGYTDYELEAVLKSSHQTVSASRRSLVVDNYLVDSGKTRKNQNDNDCIVWITTDYSFGNGMLFADA